MKICVFSDSHAYAANMIAAIELEQADCMFFLGDGAKDLQTVQERFPWLPIYAVCGNCDFMSGLEQLLRCEVEGVRIFAVHGHRSNVNYEYRMDTLASQAIEAGADIALFGHTHKQYLYENKGVTLINPGSIGRGYYPGYALLTIEDGKFDAELKTI